MVPLLVDLGALQKNSPLITTGNENLSVSQSRCCVIGAGGEIKLKFEAGQEQRMRLQMEGVTFRGKRVDMAEHQHRFKTWEF